MRKVFVLPPMDSLRRCVSLEYPAIFQVVGDLETARFCKIATPSASNYSIPKTVSRGGLEEQLRPRPAPLGLQDPGPVDGPPDGHVRPEDVRPARSQARTQVSSTSEPVRPARLRAAEVQGGSGSRGPSPVR